MRFKKIIALTAALVIALSLFASCGSSGKEDTNAPEGSGKIETDSDGNIYLEDGVRLRDISVDMVGSTPNFMVILANENDNAVEFDCSKFELKKADGSVLKTTAGAKTLDADQSYIQWAFPVTDGEAAVGDEISIYYGGALVAEVTVTEF